MGAAHRATRRRHRAGLGIVGLASFNVARRTKQIGTRRALGASRPAILRYFLLENFLVSCVGITGGAVWEDLKMGIERLTKWKRIALVTEMEQSER